MSCICLYYQTLFIQWAFGFHTTNTLVDDKGVCKASAEGKSSKLKLHDVGETLPSILVKPKEKIVFQMQSSADQL